MGFHQFLDDLWIVDTVLVWRPFPNEWYRVRITAADCAFLARMNIKW